MVVLIAEDALKFEGLIVGGLTSFKLIRRLQRRISLATLRRYGRRCGWFMKIMK